MTNRTSPRNIIEYFIVQLVWGSVVGWTYRHEHTPLWVALVISLAGSLAIAYGYFWYPRKEN